ncbi:Ig-like domain-containing protein [Burkholderia pyrrocinia]
MRVLTAVENAHVISTSDTSVTFDGSIDLTPGSVFLTNDTAYQVVALSSVGGRTTITVQAPPIEAVFSSLQITGQYQVSADQEVIDVGAGVGASARAAKRATNSALLSFPVEFSAGAVSGVGSVSTTLGFDVDYQFDAAAGGLKSGHLAANATTNAEVAVAFVKGGEVNNTIPFKQFRVPIPLSVYDSALNLIGVRLASIYVPVDFVIHGGASLESKATVKSSISITARDDYVAGVDPISSGTIVGTASVSSFDITTAGDPVLATLTADTGLYLNPRPALAALNTVALLGADIKVGPRAQLTAKIVANTPPYCAQITEFAHGEISGFFKTIGVNKTTTPFTKEIQGDAQSNIGSCKFPTATGITVQASTSPVRFGDPLKVGVTVTPVDAAASVGNTPTGEVQVTMGPNKCSASLTSGSGSCTLPASPAGTAETISAAYGGDAKFDVSTSSTAVVVERAETIVTLLASPNSAPSGSIVSFATVVTPNPDLGQSLPTGTVTFVTSSGETICSAILNSAGTGKCSAPLVGPNAIAVTANYSGDSNYKNQSSVPLSVTFTPCSPVGNWTWGAVGTIVIRPDLTGTVSIPGGSCPGQVQGWPITVSVQGNVLSTVSPGPATCSSPGYDPAYTESLTFAPNCQSATGTQCDSVCRSGGAPLSDYWTKAP